MPKLPIALQHALNDALATVREDPEHQLPWTQRVNVYRQLDPDTMVSPLWPVHGLLGLLTARHVWPIWQEKRTQYPEFASFLAETSRVAELLLQTTAQLIQTHDNLDQAQTLFGQLIQTHDNLDQAHRLLSQYRYDGGYDLLKTFEYKVPLEVLRVDHIYGAAVSALGEALGAHLAVRYLLRKPDGTFLEYEDSAAYSLQVYLEGAEAPAAIAAKCKAFWEWWLTEAIPMAHTQARRR